MSESEQTAPPDASPRLGPPRNVLVTAIALERRDGSTMYVRDLAVELERQGQRPVVYTPRPGEVADELRSAGIRVVDRLDEVGERPDIAHANHTVEAYEVALGFPGLPMVFVSHGLGWMAEPPDLAAVGAYIAVGRATMARLREAGVPDELRQLIPNGVDTVRFRPRGRPLPDRPQRALVFSNNAAESGFVEAVRAACASRGLPVDVRGRGVGNPLEHPEEALPDYDLVFARGRCAREALACGCGVVLLDIEGMAGFVGPDEVGAYDSAAFGVHVLTRPHEIEAIAAEIDRWQPSVVREASEVLRREGSLERMVVRLREAYEAAIVRAATVEVDTARDVAAVRDYLPVLSGLGLERDEVLLARHLLHQHAVHLEQRVLHAEPALVEAEAGLAAARADLDATRAELAATQTELDALRSTPLFRARDKVRASARRAARMLRARIARPRGW